MLKQAASETAPFLMRLAFSVAINRDPEILPIDEILAVGDAAFQAKCIEKVHEFRNAGKTLLCVSHSNMIRQLCDRAIWLDHGELILSGAVPDVLEATGYPFHSADRNLLCRLPWGFGAAN